MILNDTVRQTLNCRSSRSSCDNKDGSPQVSILWVGLDGDEIVYGRLTTHLYQKLKNIRHDARVVLSMVTGGKTDGLDNYLMINRMVAPELPREVPLIW